MAISLFFRRSFLALCSFVVVYLFFAFIHSPVTVIGTWRLDLSRHSPSTSETPKANTTPTELESSSDSKLVGAHHSTSHIDDTDYEADLKPAVKLHSASTANDDAGSDVSPHVGNTLHVSSLSQPSSSAAPTPQSSPDPSHQPHHPPTPPGNKPSSPANPCSTLPGSEDIMVVMKTGESEIRTKLPVHFETTFACAHHYAIFSDMEREIDGYHIEDILAGVPEQVRLSNPEFDYYHKIHEISPDESTDFAPLYNDAPIKELNPAWVLDKWKFLPSLERAYERKPDAKWYLFLEADAAVVWWNLLGWLSNFDPSKPYYLGGEAWVAETMFAHGGSGYVLSNAALQRVVEALKMDEKRYDRVAQECCGDLVTAVALRDLIDLKLQTAWPITQGETPTSLDYTSVHWCHPVVTYHHMNESLTRELWDFEQRWRHAHQDTGAVAAPILHGTAFEHFVWPYIHGERDNWDNLSQDMEITPESDKFSDYTEHAYENAHECWSACSSIAECVQWSWEPEACRLGWVTRLGEETGYDDLPGDAIRSGWMTDRIQSLKEGLAGCQPIWITEQVE